jgi:ankyrin repeat protein
MKTNFLSLFAAFFFASATLALGATNDLSGALQKGLFEEEANHNLGAAAQAYQSVAAQFDKDRKLAATAIFRLGEVFRKQGKTNEANAQYERILKEFSDQTELVKLTRDYIPANQVPEQAAAKTQDDAEENEIARIKTMIKDSPDLINAPRSNGLSPLAKAAMMGQLRAAEFLLSNGADVNKKIQNRTALHWAVENKHKAMVELLISHGADLEATDGTGGTPLHTAVQTGSKAIVEILLTHKANVSAQNSIQNGQETPLHLASALGFRSIAELLLKNGADVNATDNSGRTPLFSALQSKDLEMAKFLIANKADVNVQSKNGTPLFVAISLKLPDMVQLLVQSGANIEAKNEALSYYGFTPLGFAAYNGAKGSVEILLKNGANPNSTNSSGATPLLSAIGSNNSIDETRAIAELLLAHRADLNASDQNGNTPLIAAVRRLAKPVVELLLKHGANPNVVSEHAQTAVRNSSGVMGVAVLAPNANVENEKGQTPLMIAQNRAEPESPNRILNSPADRTLAQEIAKLLIQYGADENYERRAQIAVTRDFKQVYPIFHKGTNSWNRFSLLEAFGTAYLSDQHFNGFPLFPASSFRFPSLAKVKIHRLETSGERIIAVDLEAILKSGGCAKDVWLEWGDLIEIPEADHKVNETWKGFPTELLEILPKCLTRQIYISVKDETKSIALAPRLEQSAYQAEGETAKYVVTDFSPWLNAVVSHSGLLRTSSDKTRVKVTRINPVTKKPEEQIFNLEKSDPQNRLWLRDGDRIEIPEKP